MAKQPSNQDYQDLGKAVSNILRSDYLNVIDSKRKFLLMHFLKGAVAGLGGVVGATLVVGIVLWVLSVLGHVPFVADIANNISETLKN